MNAWDNLETELRAATRRNAAPRGVRRGPLLALAAGVAVALMLTVRGDGPAVIPADEKPALTTPPAGGGAPPVTSEGEQLAQRAVRETKGLPACRPVRDDTRRPLRLVDQAPLPSILRTLPELGVPVPDPDAAAATIPKGIGGDVLRVSVRELVFPGDVRATVFVSNGVPTTVADPRACADARVAAVNRDATGALRASALAALALRTDADPDAQTLSIWYGEGGRSRNSIGLTAVAATELPTRILGSGGTRSHKRAYVGLAGPGAVRVRIGSETFPVRDGVFIIVRERALTARTVHELDANGRVLRTHQR